MKVIVDSSKTGGNHYEYNLIVSEKDKTMQKEIIYNF